MTEIEFQVEEAPEGGVVARALGESIFTEADSYEALLEEVRDAVRCHFDEGNGPSSIRVRYITETRVRVHFLGDPMGCLSVVDIRTGSGSS